MRRISGHSQLINLACAYMCESLCVLRKGRVGEGAGAIVGEMGTGKRRKSSYPTISAGEGGPGEEHDSTQGQEEGDSHAQDAGTRTVFVMQLTRSYHLAFLRLARAEHGFRRVF